ncbi:MAG TPA: RecX family transcriptional regulator, partial [Sphingomonas sp.]|nr:RecX family transcriptional regulator [Sphingomonas sp.]
MAQSWRSGPGAGRARGAAPLDAPALERFALRYVERYATTRARLADYLSRKLRERGWAGE